MYLVRELAGWTLVVLGLFVFYVCFALLLTEHAILHAIFLTVMGVIIFRGGMHLIRIAVAGRVSREAQHLTSEQPPSRSREHASPAGMQKARIRNLGRLPP